MVPSHKREDKDEMKRRQIDPADGMPCLFRALAISLGKTAAEPVRGRVGMTQ